MSDELYKKQLNQEKNPSLMTDLNLVAYKSNHEDRLNYLKQYYEEKKIKELDKKE